MRFEIDGLVVFFPYERVYLEQYQYMCALKRTLDAGVAEGAGHSHCLLEMPTGTGKTVSLLSLITSYQYANPSSGKLVYCTRTVPEMNSVMEELGVVLAYRAQQLELEEEKIRQSQAISSSEISQDNCDNEEMEIENLHASNNYPKKKRKKINRRKERPTMGPILDGRGAGGSGILALCLSSRRNMCVNDKVMEESDREAVDSRCRSLTASWVLERAKENPSSSIETCSYYDNFDASGEATNLPSGVYDLEQLRIWGKAKNWCPYFLTRQAINHANVLVFNYQYMLDPKVAKMVSKELEAESIIVFDEAHNIDSVCIEALSVIINERSLDHASRSLGSLSKEVSRIKSSDNLRLQREYQNLLGGLVDQGLLNAAANDGSLASVSKF